ncbi:MAG TPA: Fe-S cluster assembly protein SufD [Thermoanaerobaculia bacterium]|nr:Fe-S cluster assembly protein SufD [Thermoanaerobaculia bacterium]
MTPSARPSTIRDGVDVFATQAVEFASGLAGPPWLTRLRRDGVASFVKAGFPSLRDEEWRYTNLLPLARTVFGLAPRDVTIAERTQAVELEARLGTLGLSSPGPRLVFVNGRLVRRTSHTLPPEILFENLATVLRLAPERVEKALVAAPSAHPFVALNDAFLDTGALVHVGKGLTAPAPLVVVHLSTSASGTPAPLMSHLRNLVVLEENAAATVVEVFLGTDEMSFTNAVTQAVVGENARLTHVKVQLEGRLAFHVGNLFLSHARGARSASHVYSFGGATVRNEIAATLSGEGSGTELYGLFAAAAGQNVDCHTVIDHAAPRADSLELYKGILDGNGRGAFDGKVIVREGAVKTDARQTNRNLILSNDALVDSKPQLVIHNNDVRCTHGSTTGRIDADALFYLRSRGLSEGAARALLTYAFGSEVVSKVAAPDVKALLEDRLHAWLPAAAAAVNA